MKKSVRFLALAVIAGSAFALTSCTDDHTHSYNTEEWAKNETMHWHAATCGHTELMQNASGHVDNDHDGECDVCLYVGDHVHTFEDTYSYDANGHWYAADCFHDVKSGEGEHNPNALGVCEDCGYQVSEPDTTTVEKAIALGVSQASLVNGGSIIHTTDNGEAAPYTEYGSFDIGEDYLHTMNYYYISRWSVEELWYAKVNGTTIAFERSGNDILYYNYDIEQEAVNGWFFDGNENGNVTGKCYGVENYLNALYEVGKVSAMDGTYVEAPVENGVYAFSYDLYFSDSSDDIATISVNFTLGEGNFVETLNVAVERWYYAVDSDSDGIFEKPDTVCDWKTDFAITQRTGDSVAKTFDPAEVVASSFELYDAEDNKLGETFDIVCGTSTKLTVKDILPEGAADLANEKFTVTGIDADTGVEISIDMFSGDFTSMFSKSSKQLTWNFKKLGTYVITVSSLTASKTYTVNVVHPATTELEIEVGGKAVTTASLYTGASLAFEAVVNTYADNATTVELVAPETSTLTEYDVVFNSSTGMYTFEPDAVGTYTITLTSTANPELQATLTVNVTEAPNVGDILKGTYAGNTGFVGTNLTVVFKPDATPVEGYEYSGTVVVTPDNLDMGFTANTYTYTYKASEGLVLDETASGPKWWIRLDDNLNIISVYNGNDKNALTKQADSEGGSGGEETPTGAPLTLGDNSVTITDTYSYIDEYTFTPTAAGTYTFTLPAGIGMNTDPENYNHTPEVDFYSNESGATYSVTLDANEAYTVYFGCIEKCTVTVSIKEGGVSGGEEEDVPTLQLGTNSISVTAAQAALGSIEYTFTTTVAGSYTFASNDLGARVFDADGNMIGMGMVSLEADTTYTVVVLAMAAGDYTLEISVEEASEGGSEEDLPTLQLGTNSISVTDADAEVGGIDYAFTTTDAGSYTFASNDLGARVFDADGNMIGMGMVSLEANTTYTVKVLAVAAGDYTLTISVTAAEGGTDTPDGSADNPYDITIPTELEVDYSGTGLVWYEFTLTETTTFTVTFTRNDNWDADYWDTWIKWGTTTADLGQSWEKEVSSLTLEAGTYQLGIGTWSENGTAQILKVSIALATTEDGGDEGGSEEGSVVTYLSAKHASGRYLQVEIDATAGTMTLTRSDMSGNFGTGGVQTASYTYAYDGTNVTATNVSGQACTFTWNADGSPATITWGSAVFTDFVQQ